ncbi:uncharacterized protein LOC112570598 isoform X3 [Pomacea canaliculata]|uniref:uncharacterized protein LOC112570598 isoform X3 n=1 Tax=Pomacea canaliculata TaxID=400727 RepID=UPI000D73A01D|nr:uncharacterized protein LOC112570598 isoform X3 [Pomacea canaliculata]
MVITGINLQGSGESAVAQLNDTVSEEDSSAIATEDQAMIMQQMTEEIQENCNILTCLRKMILWLDHHFQKLLHQKDLLGQSRTARTVILPNRSSSTVHVS